MSSAVLSPRTPAVSITDAASHASSSSRPQRTRRPVIKPYSPAATPSSASTSQSTRITRSRASKSPDKASTEQQKSQEHDRAIGDIIHVVNDGPLVQPKPSSGLDASVSIDGKDEEGEEELDGASIEDKPQSELSDSDMAQIQTSDDKPPVPRIRLRVVFNSSQAEPAIIDDGRSELTEPDPILPSAGNSPHLGEKRPLDGADEDVDEDVDARALQQAIAEMDSEPVKRAPRKKRKWLKRGQVDLDDPAAVAKQQARHRLIDRAINDLDRQIEAIDNGSHASLLWILKELERRKAQQLARLDARHEAAMLELGRVHDQAMRQHRTEFIATREQLVEDMQAENRNAASKLSQQNVVNKVITDTYPAPRDGRGGGGWQSFPSDYLSTHRETLVPAGARLEGFRRDTSIAVTGIDRELAQDDLATMMARPSVKKEASSSRRRKGTALPSAGSSASPVPSVAAEQAPRAVPGRAALIAENRAETANPNAARSNYAAAPASASYAINPTPVPPKASRDPEGYVPPFPLYHSAPMGRPEFISWEDYRVYANCDAWGCPLPHDRMRKDLVLRESWEKNKGLIRKSVVFDARVNKTQRASGQARTTTGQSRATSSRPRTTVTAQHPAQPSNAEAQQKSSSSTRHIADPMSTSSQTARASQIPSSTPAHDAASRLALNRPRDHGLPRDNSGRPVQTGSAHSNAWL